MNDFINKINARKFPMLEGFRASMKKLLKYGLSEKDCLDGVQSACAFFDIPMPALIADLTNQPGGQTMFVDFDKNSFADDVICYDLEQLLRLGVRNVQAYTLVMTHECAHRVLQNTKLPGAMMVNGKRNLLQTSLWVSGRVWKVSRMRHSARYAMVLKEVAVL